MAHSGEYSFFFLCLEEVRVHLQSLLTETNKKQKIIQGLMDNENVKFYWLIVGADFEEDNEKVHSNEGIFLLVHG